MIPGAYLRGKGCYAFPRLVRQEGWGVKLPVCLIVRKRYLLTDSACLTLQCQSARPRYETQDKRHMIEYL